MYPATPRVTYEVGDLVLYHHPVGPCGVCFFCINKSNNIGVIIQAWNPPGPESNMGMIVAFDVGEWVFREHDLEDIEILSRS